jgi:deazaflavin-dependent oxidoreductase (nitroreductase family)
MTSDDGYRPSPADWVRTQVEKFESSGGTEGNTLREVPIVVMTMRGARTGALRKVPVMRIEHDGSYAAVASQGGAPEHPLWYHNLKADPEIELQDGPNRTQMTARELAGDERDFWWSQATAVWPDYDTYQTKTDRQIPVFVLEPVS